ncbi:entry exclusion protein 1, partial [Salmonella enterica]|nr:entry exclusion protein 1 [Salmonella enterica]EEU9481929.1 entry exclusion protein 1 [Escherichia coli]EEF6273130.1 entry exclusion protein 1 [Salmonella enterica]EEV5591694.1 entry exclusion protein 1 [Escherichia coli]EEW2133682.1 entry exclusion protein 1 [Escherichia coli]
KKNGDSGPDCSAGEHRLQVMIR